MTKAGDFSPAFVFVWLRQSSFATERLGYLRSSMSSIRHRPVLHGPDELDRNVEVLVLGAGVTSPEPRVPKPDAKSRSPKPS